MENKNTILFLVVGILVGAAVGAGAGYMLWNDGGDDTETYWYYIDYGAYETEDIKDGWISAESDTPLNGLIKALDDNKIEYSIENASINSINNLPNLATEYWGQWQWTAKTFDTSLWAWKTTPGFNATNGTIFYLGITTWDANWAPILNPDLESGWKTGGPFATA